jgi:pimeloyl-ACP methyl ester carboxylesterase
MIHSSPANASLLIEDIALLSDRYTVFAPDTPGFGQSDPLPLTEMTIADLADALAKTLASMDMPPCPMFGTHTGAGIVLEFARSYPDRVTGIILDGLALFRELEYAELFADYFRPIPITDLGGQYAMAWTRMRDQAIWFPWCSRSPVALNDYDLPPAMRTNHWVSMYFDASSHYVPAYRAALRYGEDGVAAAAALTTPAVISARETDMLFAHLDRLLAPREGQEIHRLGRSMNETRALTEAAFARFVSRGAAPSDRDEIVSASSVMREFVTTSTGRVLHLRHVGERTAPPILLLHDAPGSSAQLHDQMAECASDFFVVAPDLPGSGESPAFTALAAVADYTEELIALLDYLDLPRTDVLGLGFGAAVALDLAHRHPSRVKRLALRPHPLPPLHERAGLRANYAPLITIESDGSHWYRTWLMLRDSLVWWPWYDRRVSNLTRKAGDFSAIALHDWTRDVLRNHASYGDLITAALAYDEVEAHAALPSPPLTTLCT